MYSDNEDYRQRYQHQALPALYMSRREEEKKECGDRVLAAVIRQGTSPIGPVVV